MLDFFGHDPDGATPGKIAIASLLVLGLFDIRRTRTLSHLAATGKPEE